MALVVSVLPVVTFADEVVTPTTGPGSVKAGAFMSLKDTSDRGDVALVEIAGFTLDAENGEIASVNLGGSYRGESMVLALLFHLETIGKHITYDWLGKFSAVDIQIGPYGALSFDADGSGEDAYDWGVCSTLLSVKF